MFNMSDQDYFNIDSTPTEEKCAQIGSVDTTVLRLEAIAFRDQLERQFEPFPEGFTIKLNKNYHEFGTYYDLQLWYQDGDETPSLMKALDIESNVPEHWDEEAREYLKENDYFMRVSSSNKPVNNYSSLKAS